jgi:Bacterial TniB protein
VNDESLSHLHAPYRAYALLSASERIQWIRQDRWIHYPRAEQVLNRLSDLLTYPARLSLNDIPIARHWPCFPCCSFQAQRGEVIPDRFD